MSRVSRLAAGLFGRGDPGTLGSDFSLFVGFLVFRVPDSNIL